MNVLDTLLQKFEAATQAGYVNVGGATIGILWMLAGIALALAVVWNMFGGKTPWMALFSKFLLIGFFAWLVGAWPDVVKQIQETFIQVGLMAGDSSMAAADFLKPSSISLEGKRVAGFFFAAASDVPFSLRKIQIWWDNYSALWIAGWFVLIGYWLVAVMVAVSQIFFFVSSVVSLFMLSFMVFTGTAWIGRGALGNLVSSGVMLMALAVVVSIMVPVFQSIAVDTGTAINTDAGIEAIFSSLTMIVLVIGAGKVAQGIGSGVSTFGMGSAMGVAGSAAVVAGGVAAGTAMVAGPAARAVASQMAASRAAAAVGPKITMSSPASYASAGKIEDMSLKGRMASAVGKSAFMAQPAAAPASSAAAGAQGSSRALRQLERAGQVSMPSAISSIMIARAAVPEISDEGPSMNPSNVG